MMWLGPALSEIRSVLRRACGPDTCDPHDLANWHRDNPARDRSSGDEGNPDHGGGVLLVDSADAILLRHCEPDARTAHGQWPRGDPPAGAPGDCPLSSRSHAPYGAQARWITTDRLCRPVQS